MISWLLLVMSVTSAPGDRITVKTGVRVRAAADANAAVVERVPLGTVLACTERAGSATVDGVTAPFCRAARGWYFEALTEPLESERAAQLARIAQPYVDELQRVNEARYPDVYEVHALLRARVDASAGDARLRARIDELTFVARNPGAFLKDPRVGSDDSAGARVKNDAFEALLDEANGTGAYDDALWALVQHGIGGECEDDPACLLIRLSRLECRYLDTQPSGAHAKEARARVLAVAERTRTGRGPELTQARARTEACITRARAR